MRLEYCFAGFVMSIVGALPATVAATATERIEATYNFIWNGFHVSTAETVAEFNPKTYFLGIEIRTHGLLKMATRGRGDIKVSGQFLPDGRVQARSFSATGTWKGDAFAQTIRFGEDGTVSSSQAERTEKWIKKNRRQPVPHALKKGPDPTSLFVSLMQKPLNVDAGNDPITLRTFDGDTVIDWQLGCNRDAVTLKRSRHSPHYGKALECRVNSTLVAGALIEDRPKKSQKLKRGPRGRRRPAGKAPSHEQTKVWLMEMEDSDRMMLVRAEVPSGEGTVNLYLSKLAVSSGR